VARRACAFRKPSGDLCGAAPLVDAPYCLFHSPDHQEAVAEARIVGGRLRKRDVTLAAVHGLGGLDDLEQARRYLEIAGLDTLALENDVARNRLLAAIGLSLLKLIEISDHEARLASLEQAHRRRALPATVFEVDPEELP